MAENYTKLDIGGFLPAYFPFGVCARFFYILEPESESGLIYFPQNPADMGNHQPRVG
ncbi:hypothetical protein [Komagataeibacter sp. SM21]|uniref:hypothetical protein n=1 Tax=Komagataeibacter sp. SM21 TaxID=3242899 RepID=UPI003529A765